MKIDNVWNLTREAFIIQVINGTPEEHAKFNKDLKEMFPEKTFMIVKIGERGFVLKNGTTNL